MSLRHTHTSPVIWDPSHRTLRAVQSGKSKWSVCLSFCLSACLSLYVERFRDVGLFDLSAVGGPVVAPQTQEIPLLLLHSPVVAARLCVYFCGADPVCLFQRWTGFSGGGGYSTAGPTNPPTDRSPKRRAQEKLNKHNHGLFSQDTSIHCYWPIHMETLFYPLYWSPLPPPTLLFSLEV